MTGRRHKRSAHAIWFNNAFAPREMRNDVIDLRRRRRKGDDARIDGGKDVSGELADNQALRPLIHTDAGGVDRTETTGNVKEFGDCLILAVLALPPLK